MSNKVKDIDVKKPHILLFNDMISIKKFDPNNIKIDQRSYKNIIIYCIRYVIIKDSKYVKMIV